MNLTPIEEKKINELKSLISNDPLYLDFFGKNTKTLTHGYHTYPAIMIPQIANEFINLAQFIDPNIKNLYDPFMGSGTSIVEAIAHNLDAYGKDINPLSILMSKAKCTAINPAELDKAICDLKSHIDASQKSDSSIELPNFVRIEFWFKPNVIKELQIIKNGIKIFDDPHIKTFFWTVFSETVRYVSNTRNNEFKLYRLSAENLENWNPDVIQIFYRFLNRNVLGNVSLYNTLVETDNPNPNVQIVQGSSSKYDSAIKDNSFDLLITSPPYGDSGTTVAYGQFSRLSLQWLDMEIDESTKVNQLDNIMLGGKVDKKIIIEDSLKKLGSKHLKEIFYKIYKKDEQRAIEVLQFYIDLDQSLAEISRVMKIGSYQFWVVANRTVKLVKIPTDIIISEMFSKYKIYHLHSFYRNIPNKRMPALNSPTNVSGSNSVTMTAEIILMFKKC